MELMPILDPSGLPVFRAGGTKAWRQHKHRGYVVSLEWAGNFRRANGVMVIWPEYNVLLTKTSPGMWVIGRRAITEFVGFDANGKCTGSASEHCYRECLAALDVLGKDRNDKQAFLALVDTVIKFAPELVLMPATPKELRKQMRGESLWDITAVDTKTGKTIAQGEI